MIYLSHHLSEHIAVRVRFETSVRCMDMLAPFQVIGLSVYWVRVRLRVRV